MIDRDFLRFAVRLAVYFALGHLFFLLPPVMTGFVKPWTELNARWAAGLAGAGGDVYVVNGTRVQTGIGSVDVRVGCNGVDALALCAAAILAFPASWGRRGIGIVLATVGVFGLNLIRLTNLLFVSRHYPDLLELFHIYIWQTLMAILALGIFLLWGRFLAWRSAGPLARAPR